MLLHKLRNAFSFTLISTNWKLCFRWKVQCITNLIIKSESEYLRLYLGKIYNYTAFPYTLTNPKPYQTCTLYTRIPPQWQKKSFAIQYEHKKCIILIFLYWPKVSIAVQDTHYESVTRFCSVLFNSVWMSVCNLSCGLNGVTDFLSALKMIKMGFIILIRLYFDMKEHAALIFISALFVHFYLNLSNSQNLLTAQISLILIFYLEKKKNLK